MQVWLQVQCHDLALPLSWLVNKTYCQHVGTGEVLSLAPKQKKLSDTHATIDLLNQELISKPQSLLELIEIISIFCCTQSFQCVALIAICKINSIYMVLEVIGAIILISLQPHRLLELIESYLAIVTSNHSNVLP